ncbi:MAG TPA: glutamate--tRNA ligase [Syntrophales bacterium]|nr:glutamate--tRNA ligase [Syntrophales bacterium]
MYNAPPRVRFAPSPTGDLHVGNARTALFNWLFARRYGGVLILRIEDTDAARTSRVYEENLLRDLAWLGIDWDEGPGRGGACGPYRQSERMPVYERCLERLIAGGFVYPCYCTDEELEAERLRLLSRKLAPRYLGKCRQLDDAERRRMAAAGRPAAWRFRVPPGTIAFTDLIRGEMRFAGEALGDFIIVRSNGIPAYNFAVVVDDHLMGITQVIRGEDHLSNTALQILLYRALGFEPPQFAHHALILGQDRAKLSKRHGATAVREFREQGILPAALLNYLALLGASLGDGREMATTAELIGDFSLERAGKSGAIFAADKLRWLNSLYIRREPLEILAGHLQPFIAAAGYADLGEDRLHKILAAVRDNLETLADIGAYLRIFDDEAYDLSPEAQAIVADPEAREVIATLLDLLADPGAAAGDDRGAPARKRAAAAYAAGAGEEAGLADEDKDAVTPSLYHDLMERLAERTGRRGKRLFLPLRAALTGRTKGPEMDRCLTVLGRASIRRRLERALKAAGVAGAQR